MYVCMQNFSVYRLINNDKAHKKNVSTILLKNGVHNLQIKWRKIVLSYHIDVLSNLARILKKLLSNDVCEVVHILKLILNLKGRNKLKILVNFILLDDNTIYPIQLFYTRALYISFIEGGDLVFGAFKKNWYPCTTMDLLPHYSIANRRQNRICISFSRTASIKILKFSYIRHCLIK